MVLEVSLIMGPFRMVAADSAVVIEPLLDRPVLGLGWRRRLSSPQP